MDPPIYVARLRWRDVDPNAHELDREALDALVEPVVREAAAMSVERGRRKPLDPDLIAPRSVRIERERLAVEIDRRLVARFGAWVNGWMWAASEPGGGGLVTRWCCPEDSLRLGSEPSVSASIQTVTAAVTEWRSVLEELDLRYARLDADAVELDLPRAAERAATDLAGFVAARTDASDAWYATFATVLRWYLERRGHDEPGIGEVIHEVSSGVFASWCAPSEAQVLDASARLGSALAAPRSEVDALGSWMSVRDTTFARPPEPAGPRKRVLADGHLAYVSSRDGARDLARANRMATAIAAARACALAGQVLSLERLAAWTSLALGQPARVRTTDAFAKSGRERYAMRPRLVSELEDALRDASSRESPVVRAARVYLDVCFFHPFEDGNARAARLALDHVLTSAGLALYPADPVFAIARPAGDPFGGWYLAYVLGHLVGERLDG